MEEFETKAINTATHPPRLQLRYVHDTFLSKRQNAASSFLQHINFIDLHIQFTQETTNTDGSIPFLDTFVSPEPANTLLTTVYRKPTHTDQCLHWSTHHNLPAKFSVLNILTHMARTVKCYIRKGITKSLALLRCK